MHGTLSAWSIVRKLSWQDALLVVGVLGAAWLLARILKQYRMRDDVILRLTRRWLAGSVAVPAVLAYDRHNVKGACRRATCELGAC